MDSGISSLEFFHVNWTSWKFLGVYVPPIERSEPGNQLRRLRYYLWAIMIHVVATFSSPLHLCLGILQAETTTTLFEAISISVTSLGTSIKTLIFIANMKKVLEMEVILGQLDARITRKEEKDYYNKRIHFNVAQIKNVFVGLYASVALAGGIAFVLRGEQRLFFPGWFPFDWHHSKWRYAFAIIYQMMITFPQILQNFTNDSFSPKALCILSGHIKLLYIRMSMIGDDEQNSMEKQERELKRCINDQMNLYALYKTIHSIVSWPMFVQICVSVVNICFAAVLLLFVTELIDRVYYVIFIAALTMQLFPTCYYGTDFVLRLGKLHYAIFSANWIDQSKSFKRNMMMSTELSLRKIILLAGGIFPIHLDTFFAVCKGAYSLFALIWTMK